MSVFLSIAKGTCSIKYLSNLWQRKRTTRELCLLTDIACCKYISYFFIHSLWIINETSFIRLWFTFFHLRIFFYARKLIKKIWWLKKVFTFNFVPKCLRNYLSSPSSHPHLQLSIHMLYLNHMHSQNKIKLQSCVMLFFLHRRSWNSTPSLAHFNVFFFVCCNKKLHAISLLNKHTVFKQFQAFLSHSSKGIYFYIFVFYIF